MSEFSPPDYESLVRRMNSVGGPGRRPPTLAELEARVRASRAQGVAPSQPAPPSPERFKWDVADAMANPTPGVAPVQSFQDELADEVRQARSETGLKILPAAARGVVGGTIDLAQSAVSLGALGADAADPVSRATGLPSESGRAFRKLNAAVDEWRQAGEGPVAGVLRQGAGVQQGWETGWKSPEWWVGNLGAQVPQVVLAYLTGGSSLTPQAEAWLAARFGAKAAKWAAPKLAASLPSIAQNAGEATRAADRYEGQTGEVVPVGTKMLAGVGVGVGGGILDALGVEGDVARRAARTAAGEVAEAVFDSFGRRVAKAAGRTAVEGGTEVAQTALGNVAERALYNDQKDLTEGLVESGLLGAGMGGVTNAGDVLPKGMARRRALLLAQQQAEAGVARVADPVIEETQEARAQRFRERQRIIDQAAAQPRTASGPGVVINPVPTVQPTPIVTTATPTTPGGLFIPPGAGDARNVRSVDTPIAPAPTATPAPPVPDVVPPPPAPVATAASSPAATADPVTDKADLTPNPTVDLTPIRAAQAAVKKSGTRYLAPDGTVFTGKGAKQNAEQYAGQKAIEGARYRSYGGSVDIIEKVERSDDGRYTYTVRDEATGRQRTHNTPLEVKDYLGPAPVQAPSVQANPETIATAPPTPTAAPVTLPLPVGNEVEADAQGDIADDADGQASDASAAPRTPLSVKVVARGTRNKRKHFEVDVEGSLSTEHHNSKRWEYTIEETLPGSKKFNIFRSRYSGRGDGSRTKDTVAYDLPLREAKSQAQAMAEADEAIFAGVPAPALPSSIEEAMAAARAHRDFPELDPNSSKPEQLRYALLGTGISIAPTGAAANAVLGRPRPPKMDNRAALFTRGTQNGVWTNGHILIWDRGVAAPLAEEYRKGMSDDDLAAADAGAFPYYENVIPLSGVTSPLWKQALRIAEDGPQLILSDGASQVALNARYVQFIESRFPGATFQFPDGNVGQSEAVWSNQKPGDRSVHIVHDGRVVGVLMPIRRQGFPLSPDFKPEGTTVAAPVQYDDEVRKQLERGEVGTAAKDKADGEKPAPRKRGPRAKENTTAATEGTTTPEAGTPGATGYGSSTTTSFGSGGAHIIGPALRQVASWVEGTAVGRALMDASRRYLTSDAGKPHYATTAAERAAGVRAMRDRIGLAALGGLEKAYRKALGKGRRDRLSTAELLALSNAIDAPIGSPAYNALPAEVQPHVQAVKAMLARAEEAMIQMGWLTEETKEQRRADGEDTHQKRIYRMHNDPSYLDELSDPDGPHQEARKAGLRLAEKVLAKMRMDDAVSLVDWSVTADAETLRDIRRAARETARKNRAEKRRQLVAKAKAGQLGRTLRRAERSNERRVNRYVALQNEIVLRKGQVNPNGKGDGSAKPYRNDKVLGNRQGQQKVEGVTYKEFQRAMEGDRAALDELADIFNLPVGSTSPDAIYRELTERIVTPARIKARLRVAGIRSVEQLATMSAGQIQAALRLPTRADADALRTQAVAKLDPDPGAYAAQVEATFRGMLAEQREPFRGTGTDRQTKFTQNFQRKDLDDDTRIFLGEEVDPKRRLMATMGVQNFNLATHAFYTDLFKEGMAAGDISLGEGRGEAVVRLKGTRFDVALESLAGGRAVFVTPRMHEFITGLDAAAGTSRHWAAKIAYTASGFAKMASTVLSPTSVMVQAPANLALFGAQGYSLDHIAKAGRALAGRDEALLSLAERSGLQIREGGIEGEMRQGIRDLYLFNEDGGSKRRKLEQAKGWTRKALEGVSGLYGISDRALKMAAFSAELDLAYGRGLTGDEAARVAADRANNLTPTRTRASQAAQMISRTPFLGDFLIYVMEGPRILKNTARYAVEDAQAGHVGQAALRLGAASAMTFLPYALLAASMAAYGISDDDEELRRAGAGYDKHDFVVPVSEKGPDGSYEVVSLSYFQSFTWAQTGLHEVLRAVRRNDVTLMQGLGEAFKATAGDVLQPGKLVKSSIEAVTNTDQFGRRLDKDPRQYNERVSRIVGSFVPPWGVVSWAPYLTEQADGAQVKRFRRAQRPGEGGTEAFVRGEVRRATGAPVTKVRPERDLSFAIRDEVSAAKEARTAAEAMVKRGDDAEATLERSAESERMTYDRLRRLYQLHLNAGGTEEQFVRQLADAGVAYRKRGRPGRNQVGLTVEAIIEGKPPEYRTDLKVGAQAALNAERAGEEVDMDALTWEQRRELRQLRRGRRGRDRDAVRAARRADSDLYPMDAEDNLFMEMLIEDDEE